MTIRLEPLNREPLDLEPIEARAAAATKGPWRWAGHDADPIYLSQPWGDRLVVLDTSPLSLGLRFRREGVMVPAHSLAVPEAHYRYDVARLDHPDAEFIAHARADVDALLAEVDRLNGALLDALELVANDDSPDAEETLGRVVDRIGKALVGEEDTHE